MKNTFDFCIGLDPSINTMGFACFEFATKKLVLHTTNLFECMKLIESYKEKGLCKIYVEDPHTNSGYVKGVKSKGKEQGAGAVKAVFKSIQQLCEYHSISYQRVSVQATHKLNFAKNKNLFKELSQYNKRSSVHAREAFACIFPQIAHLIRHKTL